MFVKRRVESRVAGVFAQFGVWTQASGGRVVGAGSMYHHRSVSVLERRVPTTRVKTRISMDVQHPAKLHASSSPCSCSPPNDALRCAGGDAVHEGDNLCASGECSLRRCRRRDATEAGRASAVAGGGAAVPCLASVGETVDRGPIVAARDRVASARGAGSSHTLPSAMAGELPREWPWW